MNKHWIATLAGCGLMVFGLAWLVSGGNAGNGLVWLLILACPLMHLFMGHGHHEDEKTKPQSEPMEGEENHLGA